MMRNGKIGIFTSLALALWVAHVFCDEQPWDQKRLEWLLYYNCTPEDYDPDDLPDVPLRYRDALGERVFRTFMERSGWTTNQVVEGLICAFTNNITDEAWSSEKRRCIAGRAVWKLGEINLPAVTNFFYEFNRGDVARGKTATFASMFKYTNLEPEIMSYMRTLCVQTNIYDHVADRVMHNMFETLKTMPDAMKPAATNRVARYMYFAIHHVTDSQGWQDRELATFIPAYSNSVQRLDLMRYVSTSATNSWERANASNVVERLSSMPSNQLNNVGWIAE